MYLKVEAKGSNRYTARGSIMTILMGSFEAAKNDKKPFATVYSSHGEISVNKAGYVIESNIGGEYEHIIRFDLVEHANWWAIKTGSKSELLDEYDILDLGSWDNSGRYYQPDFSFRRKTLLLSPADYLDSKLKAIVNYNDKTLTLLFGNNLPDNREHFKVEDCIVLQVESLDDDWLSARIGGHDISIHIDGENERLISIYTFSETVEHAFNVGRSHLDFLSDPVENFTIEKIGVVNIDE